MKWKNKIHKWVSAGLITSAQREAILKYEQSEKKPNMLYSLYSFLVVATVSIGLGIIALIAANWPAISVFFKLIGYFSLLGFTGYLVWRLQAKNKYDIWFESFLILFVILCLAGIGLISQIYNIKGESYSGLFFWSVITYSLMWLSRKSFVMHIWIALFYTACTVWGMQAWGKNFFFEVTLVYMLFFFVCSFVLCNKKIKTNFPVLTFRKNICEQWAFLAGLVSLFAFQADMPELPLAVFTVVLWSVITLTHPLFYRYKALTDIWIVCFFVSFAAWILREYGDHTLSKFILLQFLFFVFCTLILRNKKIQTLVSIPAFKIKNFEGWSLFAGLVSLCVFHSKLSADGISNSEFIALSVLGLCVYTALFLSDYKKVQKYLISGILFLYFGFYILVYSISLNSLFLMIFSSLVLTLLALFFAYLKKKTLFVLCIAALIARILFFYITLFKSLTVTGTVLVVIGGVIVAAIYTVKKHKTELLQWVDSLNE